MIIQYNKDEIPHDLWENRWFKGTYANGKNHGLWERYYENGQLDYKCTYVNGKKYGLWEYYNEDGTIIKQVFYSKYYEQD